VPINTDSSPIPIRTSPNSRGPIIAVVTSPSRGFIDAIFSSKNL
jgi:hypothetical protein